MWNDSSSEDSQPVREAPCRATQKMKTSCPICHRRLAIKSLKYSHVCGRTFDPIERAKEQAEEAKAALLRRTQQKGTKRQEQPPCILAFDAAFAQR